MIWPPCSSTFNSTADASICNTNGEVVLEKSSYIRTGVCGSTDFGWEKSIEWYSFLCQNMKLGNKFSTYINYYIAIIYSKMQIPGIVVTTVGVD